VGVAWWNCNLSCWLASMNDFGHSTSHFLRAKEACITCPIDIRFFLHVGAMVSYLIFSVNL
jgi:hypothetical protein